MTDDGIPTEPEDLTDEDLGEPIKEVETELDKDRPTTLSFRTTLGRAEVIADHARLRGQSTSDFIRSAVDAAMELRVVRAKVKGGFTALPRISSEHSSQEHLDYLRGDRRPGLIMSARR